MGHRLQVRLTDEEWTRWNEDAAHLGVSLSALVRARFNDTSHIARKRLQSATEAKPGPLQANPEKPYILCPTCKRDGRAIGCAGCARLN